MRLACTATRLPPTPAGHKQHSGDGPDTSKSSFQQPADLEVPGAGIMWDSVFLTPIPLLQDVRSWDKAVAFPLRPLSEAEAVLLLQLRVEEMCETKMRSQAPKQTQEVQNYYFSHEAQGNCESHQHEMHWLRINSSYCKKQLKNEFPWFIRQKGGESFIPESVGSPDSEVQIQIFVLPGATRETFWKMGVFHQTGGIKEMKKSLERCFFREEPPRPISERVSWGQPNLCAPGTPKENDCP